MNAINLKYHNHHNNYNNTLKIVRHFNKIQTKWPFYYRYILYGKYFQSISVLKTNVTNCVTQINKCLTYLTFDLILFPIF